MTFHIGPLLCGHFVEMFYSHSRGRQHRYNRIFFHGSHNPICKQYQHFMDLARYICEMCLSFVNACKVSDTEKCALINILTAPSQQFYELVL